MPDEKFPWEFKGADLIVNAKSNNIVTGENSEAVYVPLNADMLKDDRLISYLLYGGILSDNFKLGNFILSKILQFSRFGKAMNCEFSCDLTRTEKNDFFVSESTEKGSKNETKRHPRPDKQEEVLFIHNHPGSSGEGFSEVDLIFFVRNERPNTEHAIIVVCSKGTYIAIKSPFRRMLEQIKTTHGGNWYRMHSEKLKGMRSLHNDELEKKYYLNESGEWIDEMSETQRLLLQAEIAKELKLWIYFIPKGEDVAKRIV